MIGRPLSVLNNQITCLIISVIIFSWFINRQSINSQNEFRRIQGVKNRSINLAESSWPTFRQSSRPPLFSAHEVISLDDRSGKVLVNQNAYEPVPVASMTKVMTAIVVLENYRLEDLAVVSKNAASTNGSVIFLRPGEQLTVESLLKGLLVQSGNDAAVALAEHIGSVETFIQMMNQKAWQLGARTTRFVDPTGLSDDGISSAFDMATIFRYALSFPTFRQIINMPEATISSIDGQLTHQLVSSNRLVRQEMYYDGIIGGKTGFTPTAGHSLVTAASRNDRVMVVTLINTHNWTNTASAEVAKQIFDWSFANWQWETL